MPESGNPPILFIDGVCNLCNVGVNFILDHESTSRLKFAALQSDFARSMFQQASKPPPDMTAAMLLENGRWYRGSSAMLRVARYLRWPWKAMWVLVAIPAPIRDVVYAWIAGNRYAWFGKTEACRVPTEATAERFLG